MATPVSSSKPHWKPVGELKKKAHERDLEDLARLGFDDCSRHSWILCSVFSNPIQSFFPLPRVPWNWWYIPCCSLNMIPLVLETKLMLLDLKPAGRGRVLPGFSKGVLVLLTRGKTGAHRKKKKSVRTNFCFPITLPKRFN